jgi:hypothetical protein
VRPREGYGEETPEGHFLRFDKDGQFCGVTLIDAQHIASTTGLFVTVPTRKPGFPRRRFSRVYEKGRISTLMQIVWWLERPEPSGRSLPGTVPLQ